MRRITPKRLFDPFLIGTPKLFRDKFKRRKGRGREKPLPGVKKLNISEDQPLLRDLPSKRPRKMNYQYRPSSDATATAWVGVGLSVPLLVLCAIHITLGLSAPWSFAILPLFVVTHLCAILSLFSQWESHLLGLLPLAIFYGGLLLLFVIAGIF